jgi:RNA polymerase sigma-70 factor (ECF subfamily)
VDKRDPTLDHEDHASDRILMNQVKAGEPEVLRKLLTLYLHPLRRYALSFLPRAEDAEEVVQEAFVRLWEKREHWRETGSIRALLFTLTRNAAIDTLRRRRRETPLDERLSHAVSASDPTPFETTQEGELWEIAEAAIRQLPPRRQEVFRLVREGGLSYQDVAKLLGISQQTVANLMSLALASLRSTLHPLLLDDHHKSAQPRVMRGAEVTGSD